MMKAANYTCRYSLRGDM